MNKILITGLLTAGLAVAVLPTSAQAQTVAQGINVVGSQKVSFRSGNIALAGNLYLPVDYHPGRKYPAIVISHPWGGVKEQTSGLYAQQLARKGFVTLAFDASHYGESGGEPRNYENPADRVQDIRAAVGYLSTQAQVDPQRIGTLGICAGGGYTLDEAQTDLRVKAVATVVAYDIGGAAREGIAGLPVSAKDRINTLQRVAEQLNREAAGAPVLIEPLLPARSTVNASTPNFLREATEYYLTPRGGHPNAKNLYAVTSLGLHMDYFPFSQMQEISPRPVLLIAGERAETLKFSQDAYRKAAQPKELMVVPGASHFDLYDKPQYVTPAVDKLSAFFGEHL